MNVPVEVASSGDLLADRRYSYAAALAADRDFAAAAELFAQAVEIAPHWAAGWFALGDARARASDPPGAVAAYKQAAALDETGILGAPVALAALDASLVLPPDSGPAHVRALFDEYAQRFDTHLPGTLGYCGPESLRDALDRLTPPSRIFPRTLDLGCGTGLMGAAIRARTTWLGGVDLSPKMIALAQGKTLYDALDVGDMTQALRHHAPLDLVLAADVLVYVGDLAPLFAAAAATLNEDGLFAFSVQSARDGREVAVGADRRFAHSEAHVRARAADAGFEVRLLETASVRREAGRDVPGLVVVVTKPHFGRS